MLKISEDRLIQISWGALGTAVIALIGFVLWLSSINNIAQANAKRLDERAGLFHEINNNLHNIDKRLSNIEGYLNK